MTDEPTQFTAAFRICPMVEDHYIITTIVNDDPEGHLATAGVCFVFAAIFAVALAVLWAFA